MLDFSNEILLDTRISAVSSPISTFDTVLESDAPHVFFELSIVTTRNRPNNGRGYATLFWT